MTACVFISLRVENVSGFPPSWLIVFKLFSYCDCALCCTMKTGLVIFATCLKLITSTFGREMINPSECQDAGNNVGTADECMVPTQSAATSSSTHISLQDNQMWVCLGVVFILTRSVPSSDRTLIEISNGTCFVRYQCILS
jgi:hypothetical protein